MRAWTLASMCVAWFAALLTWASAGPVASQDVPDGLPIKSKFPIDDLDPESSIPSPEEVAREPQQMGFLAIELTERAERALREGQPAKAARYFRAIGKAAPDRVLPFRKACAAHKSASELAKAVEMCRTASGLPDASPDDYLSLLDVAFAKPGKLTPAELRDIDRALARLERELAEGTGGGNVALLKCQLAVRVGDTQRLTACTEELRSRNADKAQLLPYAFTLALSRGDLSKAEALNEEAIQAGVSRDKLEVMTRDLALAREKRDGVAQSVVQRWWPAAALAALLLGALVMFQRRRRAASKQ